MHNGMCLASGATGQSTRTAFGGGIEKRRIAMSEGTCQGEGGGAATSIQRLEQIAARACGLMYDAGSFSSAVAHRSDAKEALYDAIAAARQQGDHTTAERLVDRFAHIKAVFRSQFKA